MGNSFVCCARCPICNPAPWWHGVPSPYDVPRAPAWWYYQPVPFGEMVWLSETESDPAESSESEEWHPLQPLSVPQWDGREYTDEELDG